MLNPNQSQNTIPKKPEYLWYAVYTRPNAEKKIYTYLQNNNIKSYLPLKKTLRQWSDRRKWIEEPLFRCYIFVNVSNREFFKVLEIPGTVKYVSFGEKPQVIPEDQIDYIKILVKQEEREIFISQDNIEKGKKVEVVYGPFKGMKGEVVKIQGNYRIVIRLDAIGSCLYANINKEEIRLDKNEIKKLL